MANLAAEMVQSLRLPLLLLLAHVRYLSLAPANLLVIVNVRLVLLLSSYVLAFMLHCKEMGGALAVVHLSSILSRVTACSCTMYGLLGLLLNSTVLLLHLALYAPSLVKRWVCQKTHL